MLMVSHLIGFGSVDPPPLTAKLITLNGDNNNGVATFTWKTRITSILAGGSQIRATFNASSTGAMVCTAAGVGIAATPPSAASITQLFFSGAAGFSLSSGQSIVSDWANFTSAVGNELIMSFQVTTSNTRQLNAGGDNSYFKSAVSEALTASVSGYTTVAGTTESVSLVQVR